MDNQEKFMHSVKVPRLYKVAAKIVQDVKDKHGSPKGLVLKKPHPNVKALYALVQETLKRLKILQFLFQETGYLVKESRMNPWLAAVLVTELLWGKKKLPGESKPVKCVMNYEAAFHGLLNNQNFPIQLVCPEKGHPRAVRVNTLTISVTEAVNHFVSEGWVQVQQQATSYEEFLDAVRSLNQDQFISDYHLHDMLLFAPKTNLTEDKLYKCGGIFLQSKASCMASFLLKPEPGSVVLDMCAAPGMKTTHLAALMEDNGTIYAVEKDIKRVAILEKMVQKSGATCIKVECENALNTSSEVYSNVNYILVDPTCSGSGANCDLDNSQQKIWRLMRFQTKILEHALTNFPAVKRVVYSTCSINPEENELVVGNVLETVEDFRLKNVLKKSWINRGSDKYFNGNKCIYAKPEVDLTTGFFIAVFERKRNKTT